MKTVKNLYFVITIVMVLVLAASPSFIENVAYAESDCSDVAVGAAERDAAGNASGSETSEKKGNASGSGTSKKDGDAPGFETNKKENNASGSETGEKEDDASDVETRVIADDAEYCKEASEMENPEDASEAGGTARLLIVSEAQLDFSDLAGVAEVLSNDDGLYAVQFNSVSEAAAAYKIIEKWDSVISVEHDRKVKGYSNEIFSQSSRASGGSHLSWGAGVIGADEYAPYALAANRNITVAVVDSGVERNHEFLRERLMNGYDFVDTDYDPGDENGHGTHVAGIVVDCTKDVSAVKVMPVRVLDRKGEGEISDIAHGILYAADKGASVINLSLGGGHSEYIDYVVRKTVGRGSAVVSASGNEGVPITPKGPCPAHIPESITVGAIDRNMKVSQISNYGKGLDLVAPGIKVKSSYLGNSYAVASGTSMAAPHVSASIAMMKLHYGNMGTYKTASLVYRACTRNSNVRKFGKGIINLRNITGSVSKNDIKVTNPARTYKGAAITPEVVVSRNGQKLFKDKDYVITYENNMDVGTARAVITGKGSYGGRTVRTFRINPKGSSIRSVSGAGNAFKVRWVKQSAKMSTSVITGYQLRYSTRASMRGAQLIKIKGSSKTYARISKLKSGRKYYVQVRTYKSIDGKNYCSKWSAKKAVVTK